MVCACCYKDFVLNGAGKLLGSVVATMPPLTELFLRFGEGETHHLATE